MKGSQASSPSRCSKSYDDIVRLFVVGDAGVGKTSLLSRYSEDECPIIYVPTIGIDMKVKCEIIEDKNVRIQVRDSAGQERFRPITEKYFPDADGVIIVYDSSNEESFRNVQNWIRQAKAYGNINAEKIIVANKSDLPAAVASSKGKEFASECGITLVETSAKNGDGVVDAFRSITAKIVKNPKRRLARAQKFLDEAKDRKRKGHSPFHTRVFECVRFWR